MQNLALKLLDTTDKVCNRRLKNPVARTFWNKIGKSHAVKNIMEVTDKKDADNELRNAISIIDRVKAKGVIHKNTASRQKSRMASYINSLK